VTKNQPPALAGAKHAERAMADINIQEVVVDKPESFYDEEATPLEVLFYALGILAIPLVPILFVTFFTPFSGISQ
jgi:hypothetical protein